MLILNTITMEITHWIVMNLSFQDEEFYLKQKENGHTLWRNENFVISIKKGESTMVIFSFILTTCYIIFFFTHHSKL